ncbi:alpha-L-rhamnosidase [Kineococcus sp. SYSU DK005]|uniref:alpha-L-rhamnosidase n=1 Tax=Kineococcus sp. SYSU DK005 TaxID=3383126 RepID=UPI003D7CDF81
MPTWHATMIAADPTGGSGAGAPLLRRRFALERGHGQVVHAVLHVSAQGVVETYLDGRAVSEDVLSPGWSSYEWRLRYRTHDVTDALAAAGAPEGEDADRWDDAQAGEHVLGLALGNGWFRGRLGWRGGRAYYGDTLAGFAQLEIAFADGHIQHVVTDETWRSCASAVTADDLYDGQSTDARLLDPAWSTTSGTEDGWSGVRAVDFDTTTLTEHVGPPVRRQEVLTAQRVFRSPSGRLLVDFGQNLVGWLRFTVSGERGRTITIRHAEVLEHGELGTRPLRSAEATDRFTLSGGRDAFEPTFTFHGFRYAQVDGWPGDDGTGIPADLAPALEAVVVHSQLRRTGEFECSDELLNQLHRNVVRSTRGNFVDVPTDCPQRDERLGWTGDLAVFAPTAAYLYDVEDFLRDWMRDLAAEQRAREGLVAFVVPDVLKYLPPIEDFPDPDSTAVWSDVAVWLPWALWQAYGEREVLAEQYPAMTAHVERVESLLSPTGLWDTGFQFGDWLDPDAPPHDPAAAKADKAVVATACAYRSARTVAEAAGVLGHEQDAQRFSALAERVRAAFGEHYVDEQGLVRSDCATVYALAIEFGLLQGEQRARAGQRLAEVVQEAGYRISTGFAGTPYVTDALTRTGHLEDAYRLLTERGCPSWLYPVTMGATTIWERWDSMLPDGTVNPGEMTSFNHYALGAVADWMHRTVGGVAPLEPGYRRALIAPRPGGGLSWSRAALETPHGRLAVRWEQDAASLVTEVEVPAGTTAVLRLPGQDDRELAAGTHRVVTAAP